MRSKESGALNEHYQGTVAILSGEPNLDLALNRALLDLVHLVAAEPTDVSHDEVRAGDRPSIWCIPERAKDDRVVVYFHGGGFAVQSVHSHRKLGCRAPEADGSIDAAGAWPAERLETAIAGEA